MSEYSLAEIIWSACRRYDISGYMAYIDTGAAQLRVAIADTNESLCDLVRDAIREDCPAWLDVYVRVARRPIRYASR